MFFHTLWLVLSTRITLWRSTVSLVITTCLYPNKRKNHRPGWHSRSFLACSGISQIRIPASTSNKVTKNFRDFSESLRIDSGVVSRKGNSWFLPYPFHLIIHCHAAIDIVLPNMCNNLYMYVYIYVCVCVCLRVCEIKITMISTNYFHRRKKNSTRKTSCPLTINSM